MATSATQPEIEPDGGTGFIAALPTMMWQRRWLLIVPLVFTTLAGLIAAFMIHPVYESSATVLIESQQLPDDLLGSLTGGGGGPQVNDAIDQRIARARERVLSRQELIRLIRTYNLYPREQRTMPLSKIIDTMRSATTIAAVDSSISMGGAPSKKNLGLTNTIAITVAFDYDNPAKARTIAQQFVDHFLEADATTQTSQAQDTVNFLNEQASGIQSQIAELENRVTQIKSQNGAILALGAGSGNQEVDVSRIDSEIAGLQADSAKLAATPVTSQDTAVAQAEANLRVAQAKYSDTHPDVRAAKAQLEAARKAAAATPAGANPITAQFAANRAQLASLQRARAMLSSNSSSLASAQARAPALISEVDAIEKAADSKREEYRGIGIKLQAAQIQARMETEQKGERLTLSDPPVVPDHPLKPNRPLIIAGSIAAGIAIGLGMIFLSELIFRPIRGTAALKQALGQAPLVVIPDFDQRPSWIVRALERRTRRKIAQPA